MNNARCKDHHVYIEKEKEKKKRKKERKEKKSVSMILSRIDTDHNTPPG